MCVSIFYHDQSCRSMCVCEHVCVELICFWWKNRPQFKQVKPQATWWKTGQVCVSVCVCVYHFYNQYCYHYINGSMFCRLTQMKIGGDPVVKDSYSVFFSYLLQLYTVVVRFFFTNTSSYTQKCAYRVKRVHTPPLIFGKCPLASLTSTRCF